MSRQDNLYKPSKRVGSTDGHEDVPSNPLSSTQTSATSNLGPPKKAWEWHYRSFLSRSSSSSSSQQNAQSGSSLATSIKASPRNLKDRFKRLGNKLHRRSATSSDPASSAGDAELIENNSYHSSSHSQRLPSGITSSSWTGMYTPANISSLAASYGMSQQSSSSPSPPNTLVDLPTPSPPSPPDPYRTAMRAQGEASPPKFLSSSTPSYPTSLSALQASRFGSGSTYLSSSLSMIHESLNVSFSSTDELNAAANNDTLDVLQGSSKQQQKHQHQQQQKISNLSLQMKQYPTTKDRPQERLDQQHQQQHETGKYNGSLLKHIFGKHKHGGVSQTSDLSSGTVDTIHNGNSSTSIVRDQQNHHGVKLPILHKVKFKGGPADSSGSGSGNGNGSPTARETPRKQRGELDTSLRLGRIRHLDEMSRAVSTSALTSLPEQVDHQQQPHADKTRKLVFTKFHNSTQFGKDSTSAYLGDDSSIHGAGLSMRSMESVHPTESGASSAIVATAAIGSEGFGYEAELQNHDDIVHSPAQDFVHQRLMSENSSASSTFPDRSVISYADRLSSSVSCVYDTSTPPITGSTVGLCRTEMTPSGITAKEPVRMVSPAIFQVGEHGKEIRHSVLNALPYHHVVSPSSFLRRYTEDETICHNLIGPMVLMACSSDDMPPVLPCCLSTESSTLPIGMIVLGIAKAASSLPISLAAYADLVSSKNGLCDCIETGVPQSFLHHSCYFSLYHNYLLEYQFTSSTEDRNNKQHAAMNNTRPVGYAHLENASIRRIELPKQKTTDAYEAKPETSEGNTKLELLEIEFDDDVIPTVLMGSPAKVSRKKVCFMLEFMFALNSNLSGAGGSDENLAFLILR